MKTINILIMGLGLMMCNTSCSNTSTPAPKWADDMVANIASGMGQQITTDQLNYKNSVNK